MRILITAFLILGVVAASWAQRTVSGKITDANGSPIPSVNVKVIGTTDGAITDIDGNYRISVPDDYSIIVFSGQGLKTQEIHVGTQSVIDIMMEYSARDDSGNMQIGMGSVSKRQNTGNISQVSGDDIRDNPVSNLESSMQGRTAGVIVKSTGVQVRGSASLTASNDPLYVVDGVPLTSGNQSSINPANIKSMEILKDASAAAIYGSRAANGVIVITTHSGSSSKLKIDADYQIGFNSSPKFLDLYSPSQYNEQFLEQTIRQLALGDHVTEQNLGIWVQTIQAGSEALVGPVALGSQPVLESFTHSTDWQDRVFQTSLSHRAALSAQGGTDKLGYFVSTVYNTQEGILIGRKSSNFNVLLNLNSQINDKLSARLSVNMINDKQDRLREDQDLGAPLQAIVLPPSDAPDLDNNYYLQVRSLDYNPETEIFNSTNQAITSGWIASLGLSYQFNENLSLDATLGMDISNVEDILELGGVTRDGGGTALAAGSGRSLFGESDLKNYLMNGWATYTPEIGDQSTLSVVVGTSYEQSTGDFTFRAANVPTIGQLQGLSSSDALLETGPVPGSASSFVSVFSRINYAIQDRYLFQVSGRYDGSSKFAESNQFGTFFAFSGGWVVSEENFFGDGFLSFLKLKASYGQIGNTPLGDFDFRKNYQVQTYGNGVGYELINPANPDLRWETTSQLNVGMEYSLGSRVSGTFDYYLKKTEDLLFPVPVSLTSGFTSITKNGGSMENSGIELGLSTRNVDLPDWQWNTDFNITFSDNKITSLNGERLVLGSNAFIEGFPASSFYLRKYAGVDPSTGDALYDDGNGGTTTDWESAPRQIVGNPNPGYFGGLTNTVSYKNFELSFMFQFVGDVDIYFATGEFLANSGIQGLSQLASQTDRWYNENEVGKYPKTNINQTDTNPSTRWLEDGSYTRLTNVIFTYTLPQTLVDKWKLSNAQVYVGGQNLLTFTNYIGYDPDVVYIDPTTGTLGQNINKGVDNFTAPQPRIFTAGIKIGL